MQGLFLNLFLVSFQFPVSPFGLQKGEKEISETPSLSNHFSLQKGLHERDQAPSLCVQRRKESQRQDHRLRVYSKASTQSVRQGDSPEKEGGGPPVLPVP